MGRKIAKNKKNDKYLKDDGHHRYVGIRSGDDPVD